MTNPDEKLDNILNTLYADPLSESKLQIAESNLQNVLDTQIPKIYYAAIPSSILGIVWLAATTNGLFGIDFDIDEEGFMNQIDPKNQYRLVRDGQRIQAKLDAVNNYLEGKTTEFNLKVDRRALTEFQASVLFATREVPRGQITTYGEIARRIGKPKAAQAVGQALRHNPIPIVLPCHRVISSDGSLGGYGGVMNSERKIKLLKLEGVMLG
jgi:methylated-DNA-[protein]-cysteine S-methyltransferase